MPERLNFKILMDLESAEAKTKVEDLQRQLDELSDKRINLEVSAEEANAEIEKIKAQLDVLATKHADVTVRVRADEARAEIAQVKTELDTIHDKHVTVDVDTKDSVSKINALGAALAILGPAIVPVAAVSAGALGAIGTGAVAGVAAVASLKLGFHGVSDAVKELTTAQQDGGAKAAQAAAQQISSTNAIANAKDALRNATANVGVTEYNVAYSIAQAQRTERDAVESLAVTRDTASRNIAAAIRHEQDAEITLGDAQRAEAKSQRDLTQARIDAQRALQDMAFQGADNALAVRRAQLDLQRAQFELAQMQPGDVRLPTQQLTVDEDKQHLLELQTQGQRLAQDRAKADAAGVEGSKQVVSAQDALVSSQERVAKSQQEVVLGAQAITLAQTDGARQVAHAQEAVAQSQAALLHAQIDGAHQISAAQQSVISASRSLADAQAQQAAQAAATAAANNQLYAAFNKLGPEGQAFAEFVHSSLTPRIRELQATAERGLLPGVEQGLKSAMPVFPEINSLVVTFSGTLGNLAREAGAALNDPFWRGFISFIRDEGGPNLVIFGHVLGNLAHGGAAMLEAFKPVWDQMGQGIANWSAKFATASSQLSTNPAFQQFIAYVKENGPLVGRTLGDLIRVLVDVGRAMAPWGHDVLVVTDALAKFVLAIPTPVLNAVIPLLWGAYTAVKALEIAKAVAVSVSALSVSLTETAGSSAILASRLGPLGALMPVLGVAVIGYGIAWQHAQQAQQEAVAAIQRGGKDASDTIAQLKKNDEEFTQNDHWWNWIGKISQALGLEKPSLAAVTAEVDKQKKSQDDLTNSVQSATDKIKAQNDALLGAAGAEISYGDALKRAQDSLTQHGRTVDLNTDSGRRNQEAFLDLIKAAQADDDAMRANGVGLDILRSKHEDHVRQLQAVAAQMGYNRGEADRLIGTYRGIPPSINTDFIANTFPAVQAVQGMVGAINNAIGAMRLEDITVRFQADTGNILAQGKASGGAVFGPGTETSDSVPALLSAGEHVWTAAEVRQAGGHGSVIRLRQLAAAGGLPRFALGGPADLNYSAVGIPGVADANAQVIRALHDRFLQGMAPGPGSGVERWTGMVQQALTIMHQSLNYVGTTLRRMNQESGGDPTIVNRWDSNWAAGTPSVGLMQVIGPTYRANRVIDTGPYLYGVSVNPLANTLASMHYAIGRYGSIPAAYNQAGGYANGGVVTSPTLANIGEAGPEAIVPLTRPGRARQVMAQAGLGGTGVHIEQVHVHDAVDVDLLAQRLAFSSKAAGF